MIDNPKKRMRMKHKYSLDLRLVDLHSQHCLLQKKNAPADKAVRELLEVLELKN